jgi:ABC-type phosphate/phosphonate transport system ATPase subunit
MFLEGTVTLGLGSPAFVYQDLRLVPQATLLENVLCARLSRHGWMRTLFGFPKADREAALARLADVDLARLANRRVMEVSGGERQRTAIARALFQCSPLLLADEPMANLDGPLAERMLSLLRREGCVHSLAVICVLHHEEQVQSCADRALRLLGDGKWRIDVIDR